MASHCRSEEILNRFEDDEVDLLWGLYHLEYNHENNSERIMGKFAYVVVEIGELRGVGYDDDVVWKYLTMKQRAVETAG